MSFFPLKSVNLIVLPCWSKDEKSEPTLDPASSKDPFPIIRAEGQVPEAVACFRMLGRALDFPLKADVLKGLLEENIQRSGALSLQLCAAIAELSPLRLYAAAMFPGLILAGLYIVYVIVRVFLNPGLAPKPRAEDVPPVAKIYLDLLVSFVPLTLLIATVLGSILGGLATPAEAAAMGALGACPFRQSS